MSREWVPQDTEEATKFSLGFPDSIPAYIETSAFESSFFIDHDLFKYIKLKKMQLQLQKYSK